MDQVAEIVRTGVGVGAGVGVAVMIVEHDLHLAFGVADDIVVLARGTVAHRAGTAAFRNDPDTAHRLLGVMT